MRSLISLILALPLGGVLFFQACSKTKVEVDPCDPAGNVYINDRHYLDRDYVNEDGTLNYRKYFDNRGIQASPCDPLNKRKKAPNPGKNPALP